jgi:hypothetical protein
MTAKPVIARIWRGRTTLARADEYASYLYEVGIRPLEEKALAVMQLREDREHETEFVTISYWASVEAMSSPRPAPHPQPAARSGIPHRIAEVGAGARHHRAEGRVRRLKQTRLMLKRTRLSIRHPEVRAQKASKDERPRISGPSPFEARSLRSLAPQDDGDGAREADSNWWRA